MNILVTGAAGFLGGHMAAQQHIAGHQVYGLVHDTRPYGDAEWTPISGDVTDYPRMLEIILNREIHEVYHYAGKTIVRNCAQDPVGCVRTNVIGTACVLEAVRQAGVVSGVMCMESDKSYGPTSTPYKESQALEPHGIYEASKACTSLLIRSFWKNYRVPVFGVRSANVYGPGDRQLSRIVPGTIVRLLRGQRPVIVEGAGDFAREYIYVGDHLRYATALMSIKPWGESYNIGSGDTSTVAGLIATICQIMGASGTCDLLPRRTEFLEIVEQSLDLTKLLGSVPRQTTPLGDALAATVPWYKHNLHVL